MKVTLSGKEFTLRCDMRALADAKREHGVDIAQLAKADDDVVGVGTLVYHMAKSGAKFAEAPFKYDLDGFLALIEFADLAPLVESIGTLMGGQKGQKKEKGKL